MFCWPQTLDINIAVCILTPVLKFKLAAQLTKNLPAKDTYWPNVDTTAKKWFWEITMAVRTLEGVILWRSAYMF